MYAKFFGLRQEPFAIAPDPRYLFMSERHREALAHLLYGLRGGGGFVLLTGEIGAGKTTVCRCFLEQIPKRCNVAYIFNPKLTVIELLKTICDEFRIPLDERQQRGETVKDFLDPLNEFLLKTHAVGQNNVLIIDEAQNLSPDVLEQLRLLTNLETTERKLLQIILIGQPELRDMLAKPELEQLAQRVIARYHLQALSAEESMQYIRHRLSVAGFEGPLPFDREARKRIHELSRGVPRRINLLCDRALLGAYASGRNRVDRDTVDKAASEVFGTNAGAAPTRKSVARTAAMASIVVLGVGAMVWGLLSQNHDANATRSGTGVAVATAASAAASAASATAMGTAAASPAVARRPVEPAEVLRQSLRNDADAWRELAASWKVTLPAGADPCAQALQQKLQCFKGEGGLALARQLARPGILTVRDESGGVGHVLLTGISDQTATLRSGGVVQTVNLVALSQMWRGEFWTLWRTPEGYQPRLATGQTGPTVDWLAAQLARAHGEPAPATGRKFDAALQAKVLAFQQSQGLRPDGLVGPVTYMQLNRAGGVEEPRLLVEAAAN